MGVKDLWSILKDLSEKKDLSFLTGKRVAIDLSGWVVQATSTIGLKEARKSYLRHLFFRVQYLLNNGIHPIFVMEGKMPALKLATFKKRNCHSPVRSDNVSRSSFDKVLNQCQDILSCLGVPCIKSSGEAEALCAFLNANKIVDGVISEDNDAFLYGADTVLREFTIDDSDPHVKLYSLHSSNNQLALDRSKLIAIALLLGCDYIEGVQGIGKEGVIKLLQELQNCDDILQRFKDWKQLSVSKLFPGYDSGAETKGSHCNHCSHIGTYSKHKKEGCNMCKCENTCLSADDNRPCTCSWHEVGFKRKMEIKVYHAVQNIKDFPNLEVIEEYLNYTDIIPEEEELDWKTPNLKEFQVKAFQYLGWTMEYSLKKCLPIIISWQHFQICKQSPMPPSNLFYKPFKILKSQTVKGIKHLEIQWTSIDNPNDVEDLITVEVEERFKNSYPEITESYFESVMKNKNESKSKAKSKATKSPKDNKKMTQFFPVRGKAHDRKDLEIKVLKQPNKNGLGSDVNSDEPHVKKQCVS